MNTAIKEAFLRQALRREIRQKVTSKIIKEEASLYSTFVEPFTDVLQAVNLASQDFLNSYLTYLRMYITFSPEKGRELLKKHDERKAKIAEKWKPLMEKTDAALSTGDADIVALVLAPQVFALSAVGAKAAEYGGDIKDFVNNTGLTSMLSALPGMGFIAALDDDEKPEEKDKNMSLVDKLSVLFFGAVAGKTIQLSFKKAAAEAQMAAEKAASGQKNEGLIKEQSKKDLEKDFEKFLEDSGLLDVFEDDAKEMVDSLKETIQQFDEDYTRKELLIKNLQAAQDLEGFVKAFEDANQVKSELVESLHEQDDSNAEMPDPAKIKKDIDAAVAELAKSEEFIEKTKQESNKEEVTDEQLKLAAEKVIFLDSMKSFEAEVGGFDQALADLRSETGKMLQEILPSKAGIDLLKKSKNPESKKVVDLVEKTKQKFSVK